MCYIYKPFVLVKKTDISELIEDFDAENTKIQVKCTVSRMYSKNYDISSVKDGMFYSTRLSLHYSACP